VPFQAFAGKDLSLRRDVRAAARGGGHGPHRPVPLHRARGIAQGTLPRRVDDVRHGRRRRLDRVPRHREVPSVERVHGAGQRDAQASRRRGIVPDGMRTHREMGGEEGLGAIEVGFY